MFDFDNDDISGVDENVFFNGVDFDNYSFDNEQSDDLAEADDGEDELDSDDDEDDLNGLTELNFDLD